ncbi:hypothetical protein GC170_21760 [bacterium]|nr:hypothetical protein [bacterium]
MQLRLYYLPLMCLVPLTILPVDSASAQSRRRAAAPAKSRSSAPRGSATARWMGQTGEDFAGKATTLGANGIQDIRIDVVGIPVGQVSSIVLKGHGGGEWQWAPNGMPPGGWAIHMIPDAANQTAQLFFESGQEENGREFELKWTVPGQPERSVYFPGGKADPTRPVASARIAARWIGQENGKPVDITNPSPAVGPDGLEDAVIELSGLSDRDEVAAVEVRSEDDKYHWSFGVNPKGAWNAELVREPKNSPTARLVLALPPKNSGSLDDRKLEVRLRYASEAVTEADLVAGGGVADKPMPSLPLPKVTASKIKAKWLGPATRSKAGAGAVRLELSGMASDPRVMSAVLTDPAGFIYATQNAKSELPFQPLLVERSGTDKATLEFLPARDLEGQSLSIALTYADGSFGFVDVQAGATDIDRRIPQVSSSRTQVRPGQDLQAAVNRGGTVVLADGEYDLSATLTLDRPVRIEAAPNARPELNFSGRSNEPWRSAVKIRSGGVSLSGISIRCGESIDWKEDVAYGPAVISTTDPDDRGFDHDATHWGVVLEKVEITGPPGSRGSAQPPEAVKLVKVLNGALGRIEGCVLKGGTVHLAGGPWKIAQNRHDGPLPGTFSYDAFAVTRPLDLEILSNRVEPTKGSGKLWRFANLTQQAYGVRVEGNIVRNVGPRKDDTIGDMNANEILLTESYRLKFEGVPSAVSSDGTVVVMSETPGGPAAPGDAVTILTGEQAGEFVTVVQNLGNGAIRVNPPVASSGRSASRPVISVASGFRETRIERNSIDATGSENAFNLCLAGNHFGTIVAENVLTGGGESLRITAFPTESPNVWGWSHAPMANLVIRDNRISGSALPARVATDQGPTIKSSAGRTYFSADLKGNAFGASSAGTALRIGDPGTLDASGTVVNLKANTADPASAEIEVVSGRVNGKDHVEKRIPVR